MNFVATTEFVH